MTQMADEIQHDVGSDVKGVDDARMEVRTKVLPD